jgi:hypothetical protein
MLALALPLSRQISALKYAVDVVTSLLYIPQISKQKKNL